MCNESILSVTRRGKIRVRTPCRSPVAAWRHANAVVWRRCRETGAATWMAVWHCRGVWWLDAGPQAGACRGTLAACRCQRGQGLNGASWPSAGESGGGMAAGGWRASCPLLRAVLKRPRTPGGGRLFQGRAWSHRAGQKAGYIWLWTDMMFQSVRQ